LKELISLTKTIFDSSEQFLNQIVLKEKSENKLCKIARYIKTHPDKLIEKQIQLNKLQRPSINEACLTPGNLGTDFD